jgi:hypothetical protein
MMTIMLSPLPMGIASESQLHYDSNTMIICWSAIVMSVVLMGDILINFLKGRSKEKNVSV